ncbi:purine permease [Alphaproteobacteria bacterium]|jgi:xanthine permease|nr:purine permease [Alphaproteobacteria bacterium]MDA8873792.1 purine permease [Alphaproteobacteria bacterium]MDA9013661.1 purine permease [Alphaproteobacteria bacterium]
MTNPKIGTSEQLKDPNHEIPLGPRTALGIQHVLAMFASNVTPSIIIAGAAGFAFGGEDMVYLVQMAMLFAGVATLFQTIGFGPIGARLPVMQGTSFAFVPIMIGIVKTSGMAALFGAVIVAGLFHTFLGSVIGRIRHWFPPLVTGIVITAIGLALLPVGIKYASGGAAAFQMNAPEWGDFSRWGLALVVIFVALGFKFFTRGTMSSAAILIGLIAGYVVGYLTGAVNFGGVAKAAWFAVPQPFKYGVEFSAFAIIGMCLMSLVSAIETVGDISGIAKGGANREATDKELSGGTYADGFGSFIAGLFGGLPNTSFSQNVGLISMTGVMSRSVVTLGALFLVACGLIPKVGAVVAAMPISVLGGGVIVMFGMVVSAGINMLSDVHWNRRNMIILAMSLSVGLGIQAVPKSMQHLPDSLEMLMVSGLLPAAAISVILNLLIPKDID